MYERLQGAMPTPRCHAPFTASLVCDARQSQPHLFMSEEGLQTETRKCQSIDSGYLPLQIKASMSPHAPKIPNLGPEDKPKPSKTGSKPKDTLFDDDDVD